MRASGTWWERARDAADLPARLALGSSMLYHGLSKLRGEGPRATGEMFESMGIRPGKAWAVATGAAEAFAGAAAILGIATRPAALAVLATQGVAIAKVHAAKGFDFTKGGLEYNLALVAMAVGLVLTEPGSVSAHRVVKRRLRRAPSRWLSRSSVPTLSERALAVLH